MKGVLYAVNYSMLEIIRITYTSAEDVVNTESGISHYIISAAGPVTAQMSQRTKRKKRGAYTMKYLVIVDDNSCLYQSLVLERCPSELFGSKANTCEGNRCPDCWQNAMQLYAEKVKDER